MLVEPYPGAQAAIDLHNQAAAKVGIAVVVREVTSPAGIAGAFAAFARDDVQALRLGATPLLVTEARRIVALALEYRLPTLGRDQGTVDVGGLMSYSMDPTVPRRGQVRRQDPQGRQAGRSAVPAADEVRPRHQPEDRQGPGAHGAAIAARAGNPPGGIAAAGRSRRFWPSARYTCPPTTRVDPDDSSVADSGPRARVRAGACAGRPEPLRRARGGGQRDEGRGRGQAMFRQLLSGVGVASRLGLRGTEDLGRGLTAAFAIEHGFAVDTGTTTEGGAMWGRQAWVGLRTARCVVAGHDEADQPRQPQPLERVRGDAARRLGAEALPPVRLRDHERDPDSAHPSIVHGSRSGR